MIISGFWIECRPNLTLQIISWLLNNPRSILNTPLNGSLYKSTSKYYATAFGYPEHFIQVALYKL